MVKLSKKYIQKIFDANSLGIVKTKRLLKEGVSNPAYIVNGNTILRIKRDATEHKFLKEEFLFNLIRKKTDLPVPEVIVADATHKVVPYEYMLLKRLPGNSLKKEFRKLTVANKRKIVRDLGRSLAKIHSIHFQKTGSFAPDKLDSNKSWERTLLEEYNHAIKSIKRSRFMNKSDIKKIENYVNENKHLLKTRFRPGLLHSDFNATNILLHNKKISGIFDMEWSHVGDPEYELAIIHGKLLKNIHPFEEEFFKGYETVRKRTKNHERINILYGLIYWQNIIAWFYDEKVKHSPKKTIEKVKELLDRADELKSTS